MEPRDFLKVANALHTSDDEEYRRTAVSRAYYALFLTARALLEGESIPFNHTGADHGRVPEYLRDSGDQEIEEVGEAIADLLTDRNDADYEMDDPRFTQRTCALIVQKAQMNLQVLDRLNRPARRAIATAIKTRYGLP